MARRDIPEEEKNYFKYPGEHVLATGPAVKVGSRTFSLLQNYHEAFDAEKLEQRYNEILNQFDYVVGDWGYERLRLTGFYEVGHAKTTPESRIDHLGDFLQEYCNYGCAYFVLRRERVEGEDDTVPIYDDERRGIKRPRNNRNRNRGGRGRDNRRQDDRRRDSADKGGRNGSQKRKQQNNRDKKAATSSKKFTIRERDK